ncbi:AraC family transcriptional regulator [Bacillus sp. H-16]|uniref:AraC family transcriptional regulator n=1 Tax=Alteribacter salitolerans TaxID=2912333 RepID=UPI0019664CC4|nr:helix-turn-helix domain-containing protein [Alteribacter salitolerans]MBM7095412.1 AraC family transcriptional regulator [Alteribacter salitolerans]
MDVSVKQPHPALAPWVESYWSVDLDQGNKQKQETILPNGKVEMIFALKGNYNVTNRKTRQVKEAWLSGIHHEPLKIEYVGQSSLIGVRFYPQGLFPFFNLPIHETVNAVENLSDYWGTFYEQLYEQIASARNNDEIFTLLDTFLLLKLNEQKTKSHVVLTALIDKIRGEPLLSLKDLALLMGFSQRHVSRICKDHAGVSPKVLAQIYRFERACSHLYTHSDSSMDVSTVIERLGYYDQSHFNKEFKRFSGMTPKEYRSRAIAAQNFL